MRAGQQERMSGICHARKMTGKTDGFPVVWHDRKTDGKQSFKTAFHHAFRLA
jgi:hypothetical protein